MDEYLATDHSVILTQQGEEGKNAKKNNNNNKKRSCRTKQMYKSFYDNISGLVFLC